MGVFMQQNDAVSKFAVMFILELVQLSKHLSVTVGIDCVIMWFRVQYLLDRGVSDPQSLFRSGGTGEVVPLCIMKPYMAVNV